MAWNLLHNAEAVGFDLLLLSGYAVVVNAGFLVAAWLLGDAARRPVTTTSGSWNAEHASSRSTSGSVSTRRS